MCALLPPSQELLPVLVLLLSVILVQLPTSATQPTHNLVNNFPTPDVSKMNVSQEEYDRMHKVYLERNPSLSMHSIPVLVKKTPGDKVRLVASLHRLHSAGTVLKVTLRIVVHTNGTLRLITGKGSDVMIPIVAPHGPRWADIDLTQTVSDGRFQRLVLIADCQDCIRAGDDPLLEPVLAVLSERSRQRRSASSRTDCFRDNHRKRCCRKPLEVVFKDLPGFEFVVAPYKFDAGHCQGRCPPRFNPASHHALLQGLLWQMDHEMVSRPCCAPSRLEDFEFLHLDPDDPSKLKVSSWTNMTVLECACS